LIVIVDIDVVNFEESSNISKWICDFSEI